MSCLIYSINFTVDLFWLLEWEKQCQKIKKYVKDNFSLNTFVNKESSIRLDFPDIPWLYKNVKKATFFLAHKIIEKITPVSPHKIVAYICTHSRKYIL